MPKRSTIGIRMGDATDIALAMTHVRESGFDYACVNIVPDHVLRNNMKVGVGRLLETFSWSDMSISSAEWNSGVVGVVSNLEDYLQGTDNILMRRAEGALIQQLNYGQHLGLPAILVELKRSDSVHLARILLAKLNQTLSSSAIWLKVPMGACSQALDDTDLSATSVNKKPWHCWNTMRTICNNDRKLFPVLELHADVPDDIEIARWLGEPVKAIFISPDIFTTNQKGYPVLSKPHQDVLRKFFLHGTQIVINSSGSSEDLKYYKQYIDFLWNNVREDELDEDNFLMSYSRGYEDYLQSPLQPLMDNLESHTYEVFEKDPVKYALYEDAIYEAIRNKIQEEGVDSSNLVVMVVGAGRGPLVCAAINASRRAGAFLRIYAIEKNPNAINTLLHLKTRAWMNDDVTIVSTDMRIWKAPEKADLIISELIGSFGDNELSPECLDGAQSFLKPDGIMIPKSYTSYIAPIMSAKLYNEVRAHRDPDKVPNTHFETPFIVHMHNKYIIDQPQSLFVYEHPNLDQLKDNDRYGSRSFNVEQECVVHGFAGYFESILYGDILMSTHPSTFSKGMFSWFPIFFPIREPMFLKKSDVLTASFWRKSSKAQVWYEWCISTPVPLSIHNSIGKAYSIGLSA